MEREQVSSGAPWEERVGYTRAVKLGEHIHVSGTTAIDDDGNVIGEGDVGKQATAAIEIIKTALEELDASLEDVVRTRMYLTDASDHEIVGDAHQAAFGDIRPASTMIEVSQLIDPSLLVEIEATAILAREDR